MPYIAPKKYFEMYPLNEIRLPCASQGDRDDIPTAAFAHNCPVPNYGLDELTLRKARITRRGWSENFWSN